MTTQRGRLSDDPTVTYCDTDQEYARELIALADRILDDLHDDGYADLDLSDWTERVRWSQISPDRQGVLDLWLSSLRDALEPYVDENELPRMAHAEP